jgi:N-acetylmuramoyl-L-alanine amidase
LVILAGSVIAAVVAVVAVAMHDHGGRSDALSVSPKAPSSTARRSSRARTATTSSAPAVQTPSATSPSVLGGKTIVIDPGHNGANSQHPTEINRLVNAGTLEKPCDVSGTQSASGYTEAEYNLDLSLRLAGILRTTGARVVLTRTTNAGWGPCITERAAIGNRVHASAAISIHADGGPTSGRGFHVIYPPSIAGLTDDIAPSSYLLALGVRKRFAAGTGMPYATYVGHNGLNVRSDLGGLNLSNVPKVFIETGNMRNAKDAALLSSPTFRQREAHALAAAFEDFLAKR